MTSLAQLADNYRRDYGWSANDVRVDLATAARSYIQKSGVALIDAITVSVALEGLLNNQEIQLDQLSDGAREAFVTAFPNVPIDSLHTASHQQLEGMLNAWKGKLFEIDVRDRLNDGEWVGDWHLDAGQTAYLAESATQPGWDLYIQNQDGIIPEVIQLKATESAAYIREALERYPDVPIVGTSDVAQHFDGVADISFSSLSQHDYADQITNAVPVDAGVEHATDSAGLFLPGSVIALTEAIGVFSGKKTLEQAFDSAGERVGLSIAAGVVGAAATALTGGLFGAIAAIAARLYLGSELSKAKRASPDRPKALPEQFIESTSTRVNSESGGSNSDFSAAKSGYQFRDIENLNKRLAMHYAPETPKNTQKPSPNNQELELLLSPVEPASSMSQASKTTPNVAERIYTGFHDIYVQLNRVQDTPRVLTGCTVEHKNGRKGKIKLVEFRGGSIFNLYVDFGGEVQTFGASSIRNGLIKSIAISNPG